MDAIYGTRPRSDGWGAGDGGGCLLQQGGRMPPWSHVLMCRGADLRPRWLHTPRDFPISVPRLESSRAAEGLALLNPRHAKHCKWESPVASGFLLRPVDGLLGRNLGDCLLQLLVGLFPGLRLESSSCT